ncbi:MAG: hypothetical protein JWO67_2878 [Streptosporangiaceae bacterium]|nr:hypothetical protein [Streptosporangiaceae bacterium]
MRATQYRRARVYTTLRSAHLERAHQGRPASILYARRRYDFDSSLASGLDLIDGGLLSLAGTLVRSRIEALEINEPLMRSALRRSAVAITVAKIMARICRRPLVITAYAIENRNPFAGTEGPWRRRLRNRTEWGLARYTARNVDRIAFGTDAAAELYGSLLARDLATATTARIPAVPAPCSCPPAAARGEDDVLFLGAFHGRKGLPELLDAWPEVVRRWPSARLTVMGSGPLESMVRDFAEKFPGVVVVVDAPRSEVHAALRRSSVVVLLSQRTATWREQVGLPVVEALAHGCSIVTTEETGLAEWLRNHGHAVLAANSTGEEVAEEVTNLLARQRQVSSVLADLPQTDGRLTAAAWLFGDDVESPGGPQPAET